MSIQERNLISGRTAGQLKTVINNDIIDNTAPKRSRRTVPSIPSAGSTIKWAKITAVTDANNYTADIYSNRDADADETGATVKVYDIVDLLLVNDWIPVEKRKHGTEESIESFWTNVQQLGAVG